MEEADLLDGAARLLLQALLELTEAEVAVPEAVDQRPRFIDAGRRGAVVALPTLEPDRAVTTKMSPSSSCRYQTGVNSGPPSGRVTLRIAVRGSARRAVPFPDRQPQVEWTRRALGVLGGCLAGWASAISFYSGGAIVLTPAVMALLPDRARRTLRRPGIARTPIPGRPGTARPIRR